MSSPLSRFSGEGQGVRAVFGGTSPMVATHLIAVTGLREAPSLMIMGAACISATTFALCPRQPAT